LQLSNTTPNGRPSVSESISTPVGRELVSDHLAYLKQHPEMQGLSKRAAELITASWRRNSNGAYNTA